MACSCWTDFVQVRRGLFMVGGKLQQPHGGIGLRLRQFRQINDRNARQCLRNHPFPLRQPVQTGVHRVHVHTQKLGRGCRQLFLGQETVSGGEIIAQFKEDARLHPAAVVPRHAERNGEPVHGSEGSVQPLLHKKIGVVIEKVRGPLAVHPVDPDRQLGIQVVLGEKFHKPPDPGPQPKFLPDGLGLGGRNAGDLSQLLRLPLHDLQGFRPEAADDAPGGLWSDALYRPAGQEGQNLALRLGQEPLQEFRLKLPPVAGVIAPPARNHQLLPHAGHGNGSHHCNGIAVLGGQPQHGIAVLIILEHHRTDGPL